LWKIFKIKNRIGILGVKAYRNIRDLVFWYAFALSVDTLSETTYNLLTTRARSNFSIVGSDEKFR
jgi:hypothetical protein